MADSDYCARLEALSLDTKIIAREIRAFDAVDSTNEWALKYGAEGVVAVADRQTAGRGRQGRTWLSEPGLGLWFTICLDGIVRGLSFAAALAVRDAIPAEAAPSVKWPNDILLNGRKVCGILSEHRADKTALGIGVNVHHKPEHFPDALQETASSLEHETGMPIDRVALLSDILLGLDQRVILLRTGAYDTIRADWAGACALLGKHVQRDDVKGVVREIDEDGALILDTSTGTQRILSGDLTILDGE